MEAQALKLRDALIKCDKRCGIAGILCGDGIRSVTKVRRCSQRVDMCSQGQETGMVWSCEKKRGRDVESARH